MSVFLSRRALLAALSLALSGCVGLRSERDYTPLVVRNASDTAAEMRVQLRGEIVEFDERFALARGGERVFEQAFPVTDYGYDITLTAAVDGEVIRDSSMSMRYPRWYLLELTSAEDVWLWQQDDPR